METGEYLGDLTKRIWQYYLLEPTKENFEELYKLCPENLVMIGTGKHEFFTDLAHAVRDLQKNQLEAASIRFEVPKSDGRRLYRIRRAVGAAASAERHAGPRGYGYEIQRGVPPQGKNMDAGAPSSLRP